MKLRLIVLAACMAAGISFALMIPGTKVHSSDKDPVFSQLKLQAVTGDKAEAVKKEILKIEDEKVAGLLRGGSEPVEWIRQYDAEDIAQTNIDGSSPTKSAIEAGLQPGVFKMHSMKQDGHRFRVYDDGRVAVVTYHALGVLERNGKVAERESNFSDVWVKQDGSWLRVMHAEREMPKQSAAAPAQ